MRAISTALGAKAEAKAFKAESEEFERQRDQARTAADQVAAFRREETVAALETIRAARAAAGLRSDTGTGLAIREGFLRDARRDEAIDVINTLERGETARRNAVQSRYSARAALVTGALRSADAAANFAVKAQKVGVVKAFGGG